MTRLAGRPLLVLLDVDGTLAPIAERPSLARVPDETKRVLASLASQPGVLVVLVSGRSASDARRLVGVDGVWTVGNHGAETMDPAGEVSVDPDVSRYADAMARTAQTLEPLLAPFAGVLLENKVWTLSVHYREASDGDVPRVRQLVEDAAVQYGLRVVEGKKIIEIRPPVPVDKGTAIARLTRERDVRSPDASMLFAGDDVTDEDAFAYLRHAHPRAVTIHVGDREDTAAEFSLDDLAQLRTLLERIAAGGHEHR